MNITLDAVSATNTFAGSGSAKTASLILGSGSNRAVIAFVHTRKNPGATISAITFNGTAMTLAHSHGQGPSVINNCYIYYLLDASLPAAGTYDLSVTPSAACTGAIFCMSVFGMKQAAPEATGQGGANTNQASWANSITTLTDLAWIFEISGTGDTASFTPTSPQIERADQQDAPSGTAISTKELATAGATTMGQTPSVASYYAQTIVAFAPAPFVPQVIWI